MYTLFLSFTLKIHECSFEFWFLLSINVLRFWLIKCCNDYLMVLWLQLEFTIIRQLKKSSEICFVFVGKNLICYFCVCVFVRKMRIRKISFLGQDLVLSPKERSKGSCYQEDNINQFVFKVFLHTHVYGFFFP